MEGEVSELETLDSELVMSFYDQYHTEDLSKVYEDLSDKLDDTGVNDLKNSCLASSLSIDLNGSPPSSAGVAPAGSQVWNLPDLLVGLDSLQKLPSVSGTSPISYDLSPASSISSVASAFGLGSAGSGGMPSASLVPSTQSLLQSYNNILNTSPTLELSKNSISDFRSINIENYRHSADSLLEGLCSFNTLPPPPTLVKHEPINNDNNNNNNHHTTTLSLMEGSSPFSPLQQISTFPQTSVHSPIHHNNQSQHHHQHSLDDFDIEISPFEFSFKNEPGLLATVGGNTNLINTIVTNSISNNNTILSAAQPTTSFLGGVSGCHNSVPVSISNLCNFPGLAHLSTLDILNTVNSAAAAMSKNNVNELVNSASGLGTMDPMIAQHCTLLPPEIVAEQSVLLPASLRNANIVATVDDITDHPISEAASQTFLLQEALKEEEEECIEKPVEVETNPSYKRCHLCVRIFSTKANLSSHIRHVHLGETKHSRVKSIPCPHCHKMFSRKGHMTEHVRTVHEGKKRIYKEVNCQHCGKTFRRKWGLNIHISSAHADVVSSLLKQ